MCITACRVLAASRHSMCCWRALDIVIMRWIWLAHYFTCSSWSVCVDVPFRECLLSTSLSLFHREYQTGVEDGLFTRYYFTTLPSHSHWSLPVSSHTHTHLTALFLGLPGWAGTRKAKTIWILLKQETLSGSGISWVICKSAPRSRQITTPAPHRSVFYRPYALPAAQPTASKHWRLPVSSS